MHAVEDRLLLSVIVGLAVLLLSLAAALHALLHKRDPRAATGWVALCLFAPVVGPAAYLLLGINRAERQAKARRVESQAPLSSRFQNSGDDIVRPQPRPSPCNRVTPLVDGPAAYDSMLATIDAARDYLWLSQYIFESRGIGGEFIAALGRAAARGVQVRVLLDRVGALYSAGSTRRRLEAAGVRSATFLPLRLWPPALRLNLRNHRKILVSDSNIAYVGGMNIRNGYVARTGSEQPAIRDLHFAIGGPSRRGHRQCLPGRLVHYHRRNTRPAQQRRASG